MTKQELIQQINLKQSFLCVGLDVDKCLLPAIALSHKEPEKWFIGQIIEATLPYAVAYKPNFAFFEAMGTKGYELLKFITELLPANVLKIADAKRGDIGNTSKKYAQGILMDLGYDAITIAPYMGEDSLVPFQLTDKWSIVLALTSNEGAKDLQMLPMPDGRKLFEHTTEMIIRYGSSDHQMLVVGATRGEDIAKVRSIAKEHFFLVPGIGAQGGDLAEVIKYGQTTNKDHGLIINASRSILYASKEEDFAEKAAIEAQKLSNDMWNLHSQFRTSSIYD